MNSMNLLMIYRGFNTRDGDHGMEFKMANKMLNICVFNIIINQLIFVYINYILSN